MLPNDFIRNLQIWLQGCKYHFVIMCFLYVLITSSSFQVKEGDTFSFQANLSQIIRLSDGYITSNE